MVPGAQLACQDRPRRRITILMIVAVTAGGLVDCPESQGSQGPLPLTEGGVGS